MRVVFAISAADENSVLLCVFFFLCYSISISAKRHENQDDEEENTQKKKFETDVDENEA